MNRESKQAQTLLRVFESLGVPLMGAVAEVQIWSGVNAQPEDFARQFASLLSSSISLGTKMAEKLQPTTPDDAQAVRLNASSVAAGLIAQHYSLSAQMPDEAFLKRCLDAYDGTLSLADSFGTSQNPELADPIAERALALMPLISAMLRFPFGLVDNQMMAELGQNVSEQAKILAQIFTGGASSVEARELAFLRGCAQLMAKCCDVEVNRIEQMRANGDGSLPDAMAFLTAIKLNFEGALDVLRAVIGFASGDGSQDSDVAPVIRTSTPRAKMPEGPADLQDWEPEPNAAQGAGTTDGAAAQDAAGSHVEVPPIQQIEDGPFNPMAFFVAKKDAAGGG